MKIAVVSGLATVEAGLIKPGIGVDCYAPALGADSISYNSVDVEPTLVSDYDLIIVSASARIGTTRTIKKNYGGKLIAVTERTINEWMYKPGEFLQYLEELKLFDAIICFDLEEEKLFYSNLVKKDIYTIFDPWSDVAYSGVNLNDRVPNSIGVGVGGFFGNRDLEHSAVVFNMLKVNHPEIEGTVLGSKSQETEYFVKLTGIPLNISPWEAREAYVHSFAKYAMYIHLCRQITSGRCMLDAMNLKVPGVFLNTSLVARKIYSKFYDINPFEYRKAFEVAGKIYTDKVYRDEIIQYAYENRYEFSYDKFKQLLQTIIVDINNG